MKEFVLGLYVCLAFGNFEEDLDIKSISLMNIKDNICDKTGNAISDLAVIPNEYFCF